MRLSKPMSETLWTVWSQSKKPGYTPRAYAMGHRWRTYAALAERGLLRGKADKRVGAIFYAITAAGKKLAVELFG